MGWIAGAVLVTAAVGAGMQMWSASSSKKEARSEHRRAEKMNLALFREEQEREDKRFKRTLAFKEKQFTMGVRNDFRTNMMNMLQSNRNMWSQMQNYNRINRTGIG
jgi:hypothetical protein